MKKICAVLLFSMAVAGALSAEGQTQKTQEAIPRDRLAGTADTVLYEGESWVTFTYDVSPDSPVQLYRNELVFDTITGSRGTQRRILPNGRYTFKAGSIPFDKSLTITAEGGSTSIAVKARRIRNTTVIMDFSVTSHSGLDAESYYNWGVAYSNGGDLDKAIENYTEAVRLKADYAEAYAGRGGAYNDKGELDKAIADCTRALELNPNLAQAYYYRGVALYSKNEYARASADLKKVLQLNPNGADTSAPHAKAFLEALGAMGY
jgi:tetratricopeptide (TPR) repeat protein